MSDENRPSDAEVVKWLDEHLTYWRVALEARSPLMYSASNGYEQRCGDTPAVARRGLAIALGMGTKPSAVCPLPEVGEWEWKPQDGCKSLLVADDGGSWELSVWKDRNDRWWDWSVGFCDDGPRVDGMTRTRKGAQRAAERAARKAWVVRNAGNATSTKP